MLLSEILDKLRNEAGELNLNQDHAAKLIKWIQICEEQHQQSSDVLHTILELLKKELGK